MPRENKFQAEELEEFRQELQERGITLLSHLGSGGFGHIFIGQTREFAGRYVAIKRVTGEDAKTVEAEALAVYMQHHHAQTNLVTVFNNWIGKDGSLCYTMDLADDAIRGEPRTPADGLAGYTPDTLLARRERPGYEFSLEVIDGLVTGLLNGLEALERMRLVHRDIKLPNILFLGGQPVLGDLGCLVRADIEVPNGRAGTWDYMSKEQRLKTWDSRYSCDEDLYQLGEVIYRLGLSYPAYCEYTQKCNVNVSRKEMTPVPHEELMPVKGILPKRHAEILYRFVRRACADAPERRFHSVAEFRSTWNKMVEPVRDPKKHRRRWVLLGVNALFAVILFIVVYQLITAHRRVAEQEQFDVQQEMRHWLAQHPPQATMTPQADWEMPWERVLFDHGNPNY
ncbi:MAG: hypothetical protein IKR13_05510, partial [Victivallales bacterium]|nr:hypothetical protein [Victivallales bacterium]